MPRLSKASQIIELQTYLAELETYTLNLEETLTDSYSYIKLLEALFLFFDIYKFFRNSLFFKEPVFPPFKLLPSYLRASLLRTSYKSKYQGKPMYKAKVKYEKQEQGKSMLGLALARFMTPEAIAEREKQEALAKWRWESLARKELIRVAREQQAKEAQELANIEAKLLAKFEAKAQAIAQTFKEAEDLASNLEENQQQQALAAIWATMTPEEVLADKWIRKEEAEAKEAAAKALVEPRKLREGYFILDSFWEGDNYRPKPPGTLINLYKDSVQGLVPVATVFNDINRKASWEKSITELAQRVNYRQRKKYKPRNKNY